MIYDITLGISNSTITWPGNPKVNISKKNSIASGDICNVTNIDIGAHTGTHIDAPYHFVENGKKTESISIDNLIGVCYVLEVETKSLIELKHIENIDFTKYKKILFKTMNSQYLLQKEFNENFIALSLDAAEYLIDKGVHLIGIDYLSIESFYSDGSVHKKLLGNNIVVLEGINLLEVSEGEYELICLPLKVIGSDGAPSRVILRSI
ncbi:cyclase family protein [Sulfurimonas sp.]|nr:cyclase family protein [Sulfurimonas sp.]